jgi:Fic family protein
VKYLHKIFNEKNSGEFEQIYKIRFYFDSAKHLGLHIKPMNQSQTYELYYVPTNEMLKIISNIQWRAARLQETYKALPPVARNQFINECLVEELFNTNELEGIRSSREEIARSTKEVKLNKISNKRFESMIKSYLKMLNQDFTLPREPKDVRKIYDHITSGEIDPNELPDGAIFRKDMAYVYKKSGTGKVIHHGLIPEKEIIHAIEHLLKFMNYNDEIPAIIRVAVGHYFLGYVHPFYDGNGRTSRYISSMYLSEILGNISALSLSRGCNQYKNKYLAAFEVTNSVKSRGEMNAFIEAFLEILLNALVQMDTELREKKQLLDLAIEKLDSDPRLKDTDDKDLMFVLAQNYFFDSTGGLTIKELAEIRSKSEATIRKQIKKFIDLSLVEQKGERPAYYRAKQNYFET